MGDDGLPHPDAAWVLPAGHQPSSGHTAVARAVRRRRSGRVHSSSMLIPRAQLRWASAPVLWLSTALLACSSSSGGTASVSAGQAASDAADAFCARAQACAPAYVQLEWGDVSACS